MCGIVGFTGNRNEKQEVIRRMADAIRHRGPDGEGYYLDNRIALGHRRLSIIDLKGGDQPLYNEDGSLVLVFNGEIYNYKDLRKALLAAGHVFSTESDSEVLLHGYEEYGRELPKKLRGMFAFAIWNKRDGSLYAARDAFGIKPFYYYEKNGLFLFSSEIKAFLQHPDFEKAFNEAQLPLYLSCQYSPGGETFFQNVYKLPPAHQLFLKNRQIIIERWFEPTFVPREGRTEQEWIEEIDRIITDSVAAHKISDVEVGSFLSSGVDSSYIAGIAKVDQTFTVGFQDRRYNEADYAKAFSEKIGVKNHTCRVTSEEFWEKLPLIQYHMDEPLADAAAAALYFLNRAAAKRVKVCLSGEGADELFGGYNIYSDPFTAVWYDKLPRKLREQMGGLAKRFPRMRGANFLIRRSMPLEEHYFGNTYLMSEAYERLLLLHYSERQKMPADLTRPIRDRVKGLDPVAKMQYIDLHTWLAGDILLKADKMSMANSLELRVPFLDREVFALASTLPAVYRASRHKTKIALRKAASLHIPQEVADKRKLGFPVPIRVWLREERYASVVRNAFSSLSAAKLFHTDVLLDMLDKHVRGKRDSWKQIWGVFMFLIWYDEYFVKR